MMHILRRSKGASYYFVVSSYEAASQNEAQHHEAENTQCFLPRSFSMVPKKQRIKPTLPHDF